MTSDESIKGLWCCKYAPQTLDDLIISQEVREKLKEFRQAETIPNLLFVGNPGCGKTTTARIIVQDLLKCDYLYINASDENGIDTIRNKVSGFAQTKSIDGKVKVIILDEGDGISNSGQGALRNTMEEYAKFTRFIITANYKHKIIPAIQSRCQAIDIKPTLKETAARCIEILKQEGIKIENNEKFIELVKQTFPDLRRTLNELQKHSRGGVLKIGSVQTDNELIENIFAYITNKRTLELRKYLIENEDRFNGDYDSLLQDTLEYCYNSEMDDTTKKQIIAIIAEYLWKAVHVRDNEINCFACWLTIEQTI